MATMRLDAAALRAEADAHEERLAGPLWTASPTEAEDPAALSVASVELPVVAPVAQPRPAPPPRRTLPIRPAKTGANRRKVGRPTPETMRLPARELRIPIVVDERAREVATWEGIEPTEAIWMLCTRGWETWRRAHDAPVELPA